MNDRLFQARYLEQTDTEYNAFIFGSSRSRAFKTAFWKRYLPENAEPFHMGVNDESLYGIERKLRFLDSMGFKIEHALIPLDHRILSLTKNNEAHIFRDYPSLTGEASAAYYQRYFIAFLKPDFLKSYWDYLRTDKIAKTNNFLWDPGFTYHEKTGDIDYTRMDQAIERDSIQFYKDNFATFHARTPTISDELCNEEAKKLLRNIKRILAKHRTKFEIIITPNYDQVAIHPKDLAFLQTLFGENVHDFSGKNRITETIGNYYEHKHFKPFIANSILKLLQIDIRKGAR